ncbi:dipeptide/oligopeptide/nickel ABC transporter ATP-binding protein [Isoptericola sp. NEAU-Y5]|uniref:Dipeptide/oligopeptide/nickel ABC transporter ATP-binding protein n=1 Tax=Isoptericola luteus TaxID=2879484 RepID=A0ABS7ZAZ2_9MICO|nr:dipeptide/oligopeptide/nickel ABC transporter ATP-binding protein [Isoptericola sp. NEAU-Y5]MCA5892217.1 dipeptide/oligopeptide/nickel ABC transporter ATP-binding protein [Isoptericola sp. NEAU-Y5]
MSATKTPPSDTPARTVKDDAPVVELRGVHVVFKSRAGTVFKAKHVHAVNDVTIAVRRGQTVGIVGESGSGKSTMAKVLVGLQAPSQGEVRFRGNVVTRYTPAVRKQVGRVVSVVFQDPATALNARMTVRDALRDPLDVHQVGDAASREARVRELVHLVGLPPSALEALPGQLSGGQRQRVAIARALALEPDVIVADEPTSALDVSVRAQILNLLADLKATLDLGMVFISHDIQTVRHVSDQIVVMRDGRVVESGPAARVLDDPQDDYTRTLLAAAPALL